MPRVMSLYEFVGRCATTEVDDKENGDDLVAWLEPVEAVVLGTEHTANRQRILVYGAIVHAMLDTLDPRHTVSGKRPGWGHKLSKRSRRELEHLVFRRYLSFVEQPQVYTRPQKK